MQENKTPQVNIPSTVIIAPNDKTAAAVLAQGKPSVTNVSNTVPNPATVTTNSSLLSANLTTPKNLAKVKITPRISKLPDDNITLDDFSSR